MNKLIFLKIVLLCLIFVDLNSQFSSSELIYPEELNEKFILFTDRNYYAVNEVIYFKAINNSHPLVKEKNWSRVLYVELVNNKGIAAFKGKYNLSASGAQGSFVIPSDLQSDNYYLIAYSKWMRNFSPQDFAFLKLSVINPNKPHIYINPDKKNDSIETKEATVLKAQKDSVDCYLPKSTFSKREEVKLALKFPKSFGTLPNSYCISVVKKEAIDLFNFGIINSEASVSSNSNRNTFIPELNGITISGSVVNVDESIPKSNADVKLSVLGNTIDFFQTKTDSLGKFVFSLQPTCNKNEMFISYENDKQHSTKLFIDNEYFSKPFSFQGLPFLSSENEVKIAEEIMFNMQINKSFNTLNIQNGCFETASSKFYGPPSRSIYIKDYIELPNLYEVFIELVSEVMIIKKKGVRSLQVRGSLEYHPYFSEFKPLVLIDMIPVDDIELLLKISPQKIKHIEIVNEIYIKGENIFGGIISIFSVKGDLAGIKLPENSLFFNYEGFASHSKTNFTSLPEIKPNVPDRRNTLFWESDLIGKSGSEFNIKFHTSDVTGDYIVLIRGLTEEGRVIVGSTDFRVE